MPVATLSILSVATLIAMPAVYTQTTTPSAILYADFTGNALPTSWQLQGTAKFEGHVNPSTGVGGVQLVDRIGFAVGEGQEGAVIYNGPLTAENIIIQVGGMYTGTAGSMGDDVGIGFYSGGPNTELGAYQPNSPNGYYASYQFCSGSCSGSTPALLYQGDSVSSGGAMPANGLTYFFAEVDVSQSSSSISMKISTSTKGPFTQAPTSLATVLTYHGTIDSSHATLYVGGSSAWEASQQYVYWVKVSAGQAQLPSSASTSTASVSSSSATTFATTATGSSLNLATYAPVGIVMAIAIVGIFMALRRKWGGRTTKAKEAMYRRRVAPITFPSTTKGCYECGNDLLEHELRTYVQWNVDPTPKAERSTYHRNIPLLKIDESLLQEAYRLDNEGPKAYFESLVQNTQPAWAERVLSATPEELQGITEPPATLEEYRSKSKKAGLLAFWLFITFLIPVLFKAQSELAFEIVGTLWLAAGIVFAVVSVYFRIRFSREARLTFRGERLSREDKLESVRAWTPPRELKLQDPYAGPATISCPNCNGIERWTEEVTCTACGGKGEVNRRELVHDAWGGGGYQDVTERCSFCRGSGHVTKQFTCSTCKGGRVTFPRTDWIGRYNREAADINWRVAALAPRIEAKQSALNQLIGEANRKIALWNEKTTQF